MKKIFTPLLFVILAGITFNACKKETIDHKRELKASFAKGTDTTGYILVVKENTLTVYKSYDVKTHRIALSIQKTDKEVLKLDGIIQKSNKITINTDMVTAKTKDKPATYDIQIEDYKYQLIITYQYSNIDKALEILKSKRFVYHDIGIAIMPEKAYIDTMHKYLINEGAKFFKKFYDGDYFDYPSTELPDIRLSKENYENFFRKMGEKDKEMKKTYTYSIFCPFFLNFKSNSLIEVQHYTDCSKYDDDNYYNLTYNNYLMIEDKRVAVDSYLEFAYTIEKLDDKKIIIRIDDKNLSELGKIATNHEDYYNTSNKQPSIRYRYNNTTYSYRSIRTLGKEKVGHRLLGDHYTNILLDTETGIISYEIDTPAYQKQYEEYKKQRAIIYLKAE